MTDTANFGQTLLETVRSLPPSQQEAVLNFARSRPSAHPDRGRTEQAQKMLLDLENIQAHHGKPTIAAYVESLLRNIREIRDRHSYDLYTEVILALHDAMAVRNQWIRYTPQQYQGAYEILVSLINQADISDEAAESAILNLDNLGFEILPLKLSIEPDESTDESESA